MQVIDNLSSGRIEYLPDPHLFTRADVKDLGIMLRAMRDVDVVVHLAALGSVVESMADPTRNFHANVEGTLTALEAARHCRVRRFILASTGGALIGDAEPPVDEQSLPRPISPYGASKLCCEAYCHAYARSYGLTTVILRFANVYGPFSGHKRGTVTTFMKKIVRNEVIPIYGDGSASRDYLHVGDLCDGIVRAVEHEFLAAEILHLASGKETTVLTLAKEIAAVAGIPNHPLKHFPLRNGEVSRNFARYEKARNLLGFEPRRNLQEGLENTWSWFMAQRGSGLGLDGC